MCDSYVDDVKNIYMSKEKDPNIALDIFMKLLMPTIDKQAPLKKLTVRTVRAPWVDKELKRCMAERDKARVVASMCGCTSDWRTYCIIRDNVTKLNRKKKKTYHETKINNIKHDGKKLWSALNEIMGRKSNSTPSSIESNGSFITKPSDIANYFNNHFIEKVCKLRQEIPKSNCEQFYSCIKDQIMKNKKCTFELCKVSEEDVKKLSPPGIDSLDGTLLKMVADYNPPDMPPEATTHSYIQNTINATHSIASCHDGMELTTSSNCYCTN